MVHVDWVATAVPAVRSAAAYELTVSGIETDLPPAVAVIIVLPGFFATTVPRVSVPVTDAIVSSADAQVMPVASLAAIVTLYEAPPPAGSAPL